MRVGQISLPRRVRFKCRVSWLLWSPEFLETPPQGQPGAKPGSLSYALARAGGSSGITGPVLQVWSQLQDWRGESRTFKREKGSASGSILAA